MLAWPPRVAWKPLSRVSTTRLAPIAEVSVTPSWLRRSGPASAGTSVMSSRLTRYTAFHREKSPTGPEKRMSPPRESWVYWVPSVNTRRLLKMSKPAAIGVSNSHGSVNPRVPCWVSAPARMRRLSCQPRPRKLFWDRSSVPTKPSAELKPAPREKTPVGRSVTSMLTMILSRVAPGLVVARTCSK